MLVVQYHIYQSIISRYSSLPFSKLVHITINLLQRLDPRLRLLKTPCSEPQLLVKLLDSLVNMGELINSLKWDRKSKVQDMSKNCWTKGWFFLNLRVLMQRCWEVVLSSCKPLTWNLFLRMMLIMFFWRTKWHSVSWSVALWEGYDDAHYS